MLRGRKDTGTECKKMFLQIGGFLAEEACKQVRCLHVPDFRCQELSIAGSFWSSERRIAPAPAQCSRWACCNVPVWWCITTLISGVGVIIPDPVHELKPT